MNILIRGLLCVLLVSQSPSSSMASPQQDTARKQEQGPTTPNPQSTLEEDGTPVKLKISQTVSSADAHLNDRVEFEVLEDIHVAGTLIIPNGGIAWGTGHRSSAKTTNGARW